MKFINDNTKKLYWWNKNWFFTGTIFIVLLNIFLFAFHGSAWTPSLIKGYTWNDAFNFHNILVHFLNNFEHSNLQHCMLNMLCFFIVGIYIERKTGSLNLIASVLIFAFFGNAVVGANYLGDFHGFSGVNYALYALVIIDFIFMFTKEKRTKLSVASGTIMIFLIYLAMCFNGGTTTFGFSWYPYDLIHNMGHYSSFLTGLVISLMLEFCKITTKKE